MLNSVFFTESCDFYLVDKNEISEHNTSALGVKTNEPAGAIILNDKTVICRRQHVLFLMI